LTFYRKSPNKVEKSRRTTVGQEIWSQNSYGVHEGLPAQKKKGKKTISAANFQEGDLFRREGKISGQGKKPAAQTESVRLLTHKKPKRCSEDADTMADLGLSKIY